MQVLVGTSLVDIGQSELERVYAKLGRKAGLQKLDWFEKGYQQIMLETTIFLAETPTMFNEDGPMERALLGIRAAMQQERQEARVVRRIVRRTGFDRLSFATPAR